MIAPTCDICGQWGGGSYLQFKVMKPAETAYEKVLKIEPMQIPIGHPEGNRFFCDEHLKVAIKYAHLPYYEEAKHLIRKEISEKELLEIEKENKRLSNSFFVKFVNKIKEFFKRFW